MQNSGKSEETQPGSDQVEKLKEALEGFDIDALKSLQHIEAMLKIQDPVERLKYLSEHQSELESDRDALVRHLQGGRSPGE